MLAHLISLPVRSEKMFAACLLVLLAGVSGKATAADLTPVGSFDAASTGNVSSAKTSDDGVIRTTLSVSGSEAAVGQKAVDGSDSDKELLRDANKATVYLGTSLGRAIEFSLGLQGTYEHVRPEDRDQVYPDATGDENPVTSEEDDDQSWRRDFKQSGFSGLSLMLKLKLYDAGSVQVAVAPFVETGAGEQASYSMTRSVGPKAGYIAMFSYGSKGVASLDLNAGYRYRNAEETGDMIIRNEIFYKGLAKVYAGSDVALFAGAEGRKLMVAMNSERDSESGKVIFKGSESGEVKGGILLHAGDFDLSASYGRRLKAATGFGYGDSSFTAGLGMAMGNYKRARPTTSFASDIEKKESKDKVLAEKNKENAKLKDGSQKDGAVAASAAVDEYPEMIGADIDPLQALGQDDGEDFRDMDKRIKQYDADAKLESDDSKIERELKDIHDAESKAEVEREKLNKSEDESARLEAVKQAKEEESLRREWMDDAEKDAEKSQGITDQEMNWDGLN